MDSTTSNGVSSRRVKFRGFLDGWLVLPKLLYFSLNMMVYSTYYFTSNYFEAEWAIPIHSYGFISGLTTFGFFGSIVWTMIADRTGRHKFILITASVSFAFVFGLLRLEVFRDTYWKKMIYVSFVYGLANFFSSALYPLLDNRIFALLMQNPNFNTKLYGQQRLWGSIGQAVISVINAYGISTKLGYEIMFINVGWTTLLFIFCVFFGIPSSGFVTTSTEPDKKDIVPLDATILSSENSVKTERNSTVFRPVHILLSNPQFLFFIALVLATGYVRAILGHFLVYYLDRTVNQSPIIYTLAMQTRLIPEIMLFFMGRPILNKFGPFWMMMIGLLTGTLRVAGYALLPATLKWSYAAFFLELLKGINNACIITAGVRIAHSLAPAGCETTAQGFFSGLQANLANAAAGFVGGIILKMHEADRLSLQKLFQHTTVFSTITCIVYALQQYFWPFPVDNHS